MSGMIFVLMATAWGPRHGGINAFNRDFAIGLAAALEGRGKVYCAVLDPSRDDTDDASQGNVTLIPLTGKKAADQFDTAWTYEIVAWLKKSGVSGPIDWWVGHDVTSGAAALAGPQAGGGQAALIHHMSYLDYRGIKHDDAVAAVNKSQEQKGLFSSKDAVLFAVGPLLRESCFELTGRARKPVMLVPGFPELPNLAPKSDKLTGICFGRMEAASDRIKQGQLSVVAFSEAIREATSTPFCPDSLEGRPRLYVIGLPEGESEENRALLELADKTAGRVVNILPLPFDQDRKRLLERLAEANLVFMLSLHEGFGLTGWEAIAAEVPLILSRQSGLFQLLQETLDGAEEGYVSAIDVQGQRGNEERPNYTKHDLTNVKNAILEASRNVKPFQKRAKALKSFLQQKLGCQWVDTGNQFLTGLGISDARPPSPSPLPPPSSTWAKTEKSEAENLGEQSPLTRSRSREERFAILKREIRTALESSPRIIAILGGVLGSTVSPSPGKHPTTAELAHRLCDALLNIHFTEAINVLKRVRNTVDLAEPTDDKAVQAIAKVSGWLFPWLHIRDERMDCDSWERAELGEVIELPSDIDSFAEIIMAGIDIRMAEFQSIRAAREWPRSVVSLNFGTPEEAILDERIIGIADEDNVRKALALALNIPKRKLNQSNEVLDHSINVEIEYNFKENKRWYIICDSCENEEDRNRHMNLMSNVAKNYKSLAVIDLSYPLSDQQRKFREIQSLLNLQGNY